MKFEFDISEKDRVCINCIYFGSDMNVGEDHKCHGTMPCSNYHKDNTENYFVPDDLYLQSEYGCDACEFYYGGEPTEECTGCSRWYEDRWSRQKGDNR